MRHEKLRIALYSHDTMGIGHMRRNQLIARTFAASPLRPNILMICGAREAGYFEPPSGVDYLTLPSLAKRSDGAYHSRHLDVELAELIRLRSDILRCTLEAFEPDVLIVDKVPRGALRELDPTLQFLRENTGTRIVLGLRDVLDDPHVVADEWSRDDGERAICDFYDAVWVYGSPDVYDVARQYCFSPETCARIRYTGYLQRFGDDDDAPGYGEGPVTRFPAGKINLCVVGGGQDGGSVAEAFAAADMPARTTGVIVTGPFMPRDVNHRIREVAAGRRNLRVYQFVPNVDLLMRRASRVVAMGGYNTVCELLSLKKTALIVPRTRPRREQLIRAENMHALGLLDYLKPEQLTPRAITDWLTRPVAVPTPACDRIDFSGLERLPQLLAELLAASTTAAAAAASGGASTTTGAAHVA